MADTHGDQATLMQDESFELVDRSNTLSDLVPSPIDIDIEAHELENRSEEETEEAEAPPFLEPITVVLMWIDPDELDYKHRKGLAVKEGPATRPIGAGAHAKARGRFEKFKSDVNQHKDENSMLHEVVNVLQLKSCCFGPFDEEDTGFARALDGKPACQNSFYLSVRTYSSHQEDIGNGTFYRTWKQLVAHCEHIIVWHINADEYAAVMESCSHTLSKSDKYVVLGPKYLARLVATLINKKSRHAEGILAASKPPTTKSAGSIVPENNHPGVVQSVRAIVHGSKYACSSGGDATSNVEDPKSAKVDKNSSELQCKTCKCAECKVRPIGEFSAAEICMLLCVLVGFLNGCYIVGYIVGYYFIMLFYYVIVKDWIWFVEWIGIC